MARMIKNFKIILLALALGVSCLSSIPAAADLITINGTYQFLDNRGDNSVGMSTGVRQQFGAGSVVPNGDNGTSGVATQGNTTVPLNFYPFDVAPNFFAYSILYNPNLTGSWDLTFTNGSDIAQASTPTIEGASVLPFVNTVTISGNGEAPTFNWTVPDTAAPDGIEIQIRDTSDLIGPGAAEGGGTANVIYAKTFSGATTSFTVNPDDPALTQSLQQGHTYSIEINLLTTRDGQPNGSRYNVLSLSRSFFDFTPLPAGSPPKVVLPTLVTGAKPYYSFNTSVVGGQMVFIDPLVAIGYDYQIGAGDPNFASVLLPTGIGDNLFDLWLWDGTQFVDSAELTGGVEYDFMNGGVDRFRILGIETLAGLDPYDTTAFITGLTFVGDGNFTGTMTPITTESVPEPATMLLLGTGLVGLAGFRKKFKKV